MFSCLDKNDKTIFEKVEVLPVNLEAPQCEIAKSSISLLNEYVAPTTRHTNTDKLECTPAAEV
jgi:hypothetical protein